jgi:hypothetical protein
MRVRVLSTSPLVSVTASARISFTMKGNIEDAKVRGKRHEMRGDTR